MAKDAKGHGSEKRGGGVSDADIAQYNATIRKNSERQAASSDLARANAPDGLTDKQAASALAQGGAKSAPVPVHNGAAGRSDGPLAGMTGAKWDSMTTAQRESIRDNSGLTPQLKGLEGHRVQVQDTPG